MRASTRGVLPLLLFPLVHGGSRVTLTSQAGNCDIENANGTLHTSCQFSASGCASQDEVAVLHAKVDALQRDMQVLLSHFGYNPPPSTPPPGSPPPPSPPQSPPASPPSSPPPPDPAWPTISLKLECTNGGSTQTLQWSSLPASTAALLVSPSNSISSCVEVQPSDANCVHKYTNPLGTPDLSNTLGMDAGWYMANRATAIHAYKYRWGFGASTWNVQFGVDNNDGEFDCGDLANHQSGNYLSISLRAAGSDGPWYTAFTYRFSDMSNDVDAWWSALHNPVPYSVVQAVSPQSSSASGNAFDCIVDGSCRT
jgi:hypothetical protein